jgi:hypothetical protein
MFDVLAVGVVEVVGAEVIGRKWRSRMSGRRLSTRMRVGLSDRKST